MKVSLLASTELRDWSVGYNGDTVEMKLSDTMVLDDYADHAEDLIEFAGRSCYQSFHKPNPKTARNADYIANIVAQGHHSVLEHASATFYIEGVSRALTHELIRHRHLSFSELSQRFVDVSESDVVVPPALRDMETKGEGPISVYDSWHNTMESVATSYDQTVDALMNLGYKRKQAREAARAVMPNATETKIVVTGNHRAWRDMLGKRYSTHADAEIRELATELLRQLREIAPAVYADFPEVPFS